MQKQLSAKQVILLKRSAANDASRHIAQRIAAEAAPPARNEAETTKRQWELLTQAGRQRRKA